MTLDQRASIVLIGLRGSGKSTLGAALAAALQRPFVDLDDVTPGYLGAGTIAELWAKHGEARFRQAEYRALVNQAFPRTKPGPVVALGGGTPTAPGAAEFLRGARARGLGLLIYLRARPETLRTRLERTGGAGRPSLTDAGTLNEVGAVFEARDGLYRELAEISLEMDGLDERAALDALCAATRG